MKKEIYKPGQQVKDRKELFAAVNDFCRARGGWIVSIPGATQVRLEVLPGSELPDELREKGYTVEADGEGTRLIPPANFAAVDRFKFNLL